MSPILWSTESDPADGMAATSDLIIVAGSEAITAFDRASGDLRWATVMSDTSGPTPVVITGGVVVVAPAYEAVQAFDLATGSATTVPTGFTPPAPSPFQQMPAGYTIGDDGLSFDGEVIWSTPSNMDIFVGRVADLTVINDDDQGLRVVDDRGVVQAAPAFGRREYDAVPVLVDGQTAITVTADGILYAVGAARA